MPRWTGFAIVSGAMLQVVFIGLFMLIVRSQSSAQTAETLGEGADIISGFTRSVEIFNFVVVAAFVGYAGSLWAIMKTSKDNNDSRDADRAAYLAQIAEIQRSHERESGVLTGLVMKGQEITLESIKALVEVSEITDEARHELKNTGELVKGFMDTALPAITGAYRESDLAKHDRDLVVSGFRQSIDAFLPKFTDTSAQIDILLAELRARSEGNKAPPPDRK